MTLGQGSSMGGMNALTKHATRTAVAAAGLRKAYGEKVVLDGVDLSIHEGEVFALLGPNGAGKTTTVRILSTLIPADAGVASVMGHDLRGEAGAVRAVIGVTGQFSAVDDLLTGEENLLLMGRLLHLPAAERRTRAAALLERFELAEAAGRIPATYSGGMKRRLDIAMTLIGRPRLIFLDEPTTGLDPRSRHTTWQLIRDLVADGVTIVLTTQYLQEADQLADRIAVLDQGRIVEAGVPLARINELLAADPDRFAAAIAEIDRNLAERAEEILRTRKRIAQLSGGDRLFVSAQVADYLDRLHELGVSQRTVQMERDLWILMQSVSPEQAAIWIADKRDATGDPEFCAIYLEYDAAFDWSPDDPRLPALADRTARWMASRYGRSEGKPRSVQDPAIARLVTTPAGVSSPAWDRLTELTREAGGDGLERGG